MNEDHEVIKYIENHLEEDPGIQDALFRFHNYDPISLRMRLLLLAMVVIVPVVYAIWIVL